MRDRFNWLCSESDGASPGTAVTGGTWLPPVDIYGRDDRELLITAELPNVMRDDIEVTVENNTLTLRGEKKVEQGVADERTHRIERSDGAFTRTSSLPATIDATRVSAEYKNGVLSVTLPLREEAKPKQIDVAIGG